MSSPTPRDVRVLPSMTLQAHWRDLVPLWRIAVLVAVGTVLVGAQLTVRMWSADATAEIRATHQRLRVAETAKEQLELELAVRRGAAYLQRAAAVYGLESTATAAAEPPSRTARVAP